jgi:orotidine-5'-phosphate decarboxylase
MGSNQPKSQIMIALDYPSAKEAIELIDQLDRLKPWLKVGMELFYQEGPELIKEIKRRGFSLFLDLKLHDIPHTVKQASKSLTRLGVDMFNVHCSGGLSMMRAAVEGLLEEGEKSGHQPIVIGVTQLTSTNQETMNREIGIPGSVEQNVLHYASLARNAGLKGVVCSPLETKLIKSRLGQDFITVTPGIRPLYVSKGDQSRTMTPSQAAQAGTNFMVIGRAITQAVNPIQAYQDILKDISLNAIINPEEGGSMR